MADKRITELPSSVTLDGTEIVPIVQGGVTSQATTQDIADLGGGSQDLQSVTDAGNTTTNDIQFDAGVGILLDNTSRLREGTIDAGYGGAKGIAQICAVGYELKWESGSLYVMDGNGTHIRHTLYNFSSVPSITEDINKGFLVGTRWSLDNGDSYVCTDNSVGAAVWVLQSNGVPTLAQVLASGLQTGGNPIISDDGNQSIYVDNTYISLDYAAGTRGIILSPTETQIYGDIIQLNGSTSVTRNGVEIATVNDIPTKTSDLINDGDNGVSHFISLEDLPSNLILYPTNVASGISTYYKLVSSITDVNYNTVAVNIPTGTIVASNQFIAGLVTSAGLIVGNPGQFNITTIGNIQKLSGSGNAEFYFEIYKRTSGGVETLITTSGVTLPVVNTGYAEFSASALWNDGTWLITDYIVMKFYGNHIHGGSNPTYQFQFGGITPVRTLVPLPLTVIPNITSELLVNKQNSLTVDGTGVKYPTVDTVNSNLALKLNIAAASTTGVALTFTTDSVYGSIATPETGNITYSSTSANIGVTNIIIHNNSVAPTFATNMKKLSGSGTYTISVVNYIYVTYINSTEVIYAISQRT